MVFDFEGRKFFEEFWGIELSGEVGFIVIEVVYVIEKGKVRVYYVMGENFVISDVNINYVIKVFYKFEFMVV